MLTIYTVIETLRSRFIETSEDESGQGLAEYGLILALIAVVAIAALTGLGSAIVTKLQQVTNAL
ncbi:MAG: Flp family type IVb pilin [Dehalococcoidia bacterium]